MPCILDSKLHEELSPELKAFYASQAEHVVNFTNHDGTQSINEITMTAFIRVLAKMLGISGSPRKFLLLPLRFLKKCFILK